MGTNNVVRCFACGKTFTAEHAPYRPGGVRVCFSCRTKDGQGMPHQDRWRISEIRAVLDNLGSHFFDRGTMRFFRNTMRDFGVRHVGGNVYVVNKCGGAVYRFDPADGDLHPMRDDDLAGIVSLSDRHDWLNNRSRRMGF
jgi:hypothetical protein